MNNRIILFSILIMVLILSSCGVKKTVEVVSADIHFFYLELCPGCESYETAERISASVNLLGGKALNIIHDEDALFMRILLTEKNMADISHSLPLLILEDSYYVGYEEISEIVQSLEQNK